ncbi:MAG: cyclic nucleotide-binding domain-containing protein, partial [Acidobacteria bacterium]|nr:cyclic nucleotide-binding domain-containing protein [Acidobacteriota bacterium]
MNPEKGSFGGESLAFVEEIYRRYRDDPGSVGEGWQNYFAALEDDAADHASGAAVALGPSFAPSSIFNPPSAAGPAPRRQPAPPPSPEQSAERVPFLSSVPLFHDLSDAELEQVAQLMGELELEDGEYLFHQGDVGSALYIVAEGSIVILRDGELVAQLGVGNVVGELAVLDSAPRVADSLARGHVRLLTLDGADLMSRLDQQPKLALGMVRGLSRRLR